MDNSVALDITENKIAVIEEQKKVTVTAPYVDNHYDATFASDAETLAGTATTKAISPASLKAVKDVEGGFASKAYADGKVSQTITEDVTDKAPSEGAVFDALALKANASDVDDALAIKTSIDNLTYNGTDLTVKFADEIAEYDDVWAWIKARITAVNYAGLNIGDYIPWTLGAETIWSQIAGIDTYYRTGDTQIGHHIDFISKDCMTTTYQWNTTNINNGDATNASPWMVSALKASLDGLVASLPAGLQSVVIEKRALLETRYSASGTLTSSTSRAWNNMGKLWVPTEFEVFGCVSVGAKYYSVGNAIQYPIFSNTVKSRTKGIGHNQRVDYSWWLATVFEGSSTQCNIVGGAHNPAYGNASGFRPVPLCFRIG